MHRFCFIFSIFLIYALVVYLGFFKGIQKEDYAGARKVLTVDGVEYAFRWCPPGKFMMGSPEGEYDRESKEQQHRVRLTQGFWLLETEVTQEMWESVMGATAAEQKQKSYSDPDLNGVGPKYPIYYVSWDESVEFCEKLSRKLDREIKLPTEAQWEYACRAGTRSEYAGEIKSMAWYGESWRTGSTHEVGGKEPNAWGLYDMHGNVKEWCSDYYDDQYYEKSPRNDPENTTHSYYRVYRGGGWSNLCSRCRSAQRCSGSPGRRDEDIGLRVLLVDLPPDDPNQDSETQTDDAESTDASQSLPSLPKAGERAVLRGDDEIEFAFRWAPSGEFVLDIPEDESSRESAEKQRKVSISGFWILETEATQAQWESVMDENPSCFKGEGNPVEQASWYECQEFCERLSRALDQQVQLPTEAQWEYARRAGASEEADDELDSIAWHDGNSGETTHKAGGKRPNAWGLRDMTGNVCEWCSDCYAPDRCVSSPERDSENTRDSRLRVVCGGGWCDSAEVCRTASRNGFAPNYRSNALGLRVVIAVQTPETQTQEEAEEPPISEPQTQEEVSDAVLEEVQDAVQEEISGEAPTLLPEE